MTNNTLRKITINVTKGIDRELRELMEYLGDNRSSTIHRAINELHNNLIRNMRTNDE